MDCSNPVRDSSRVRIRDMLGEVVERRRQDLSFLKAIVSGVERNLFPSLPERLVGEGALKAELASLEHALPEVDPSPAMDLSFLKVLHPMPVSGLMLDGKPIHPPGKKQDGGLVCAGRVFGGGKRDVEWLRRINSFLEEDEMMEPMVKYIYSRGTATGFANRLKLLTSTKVPQMTKSLKITRAQASQRLRRLLPFDTEKVKGGVTWHDDLSTQFLDLVTSRISSAGPPYWKDKPAAAVEMMDLVLPLIHKAISEGTTGALFRAQPELFLGEVKNKLDRYEPAKLSDKTRPYFSLPFHWQALFSMMSQKFTGGLKIFTEKGSNAYGFSAAHGGMAAQVKWARKCKDIRKGGRPRFAAYGDDLDVYYRDGGKLYRIAPDFRQMDGSVDRESVEIAVMYVMECLTEAWGPNPFFEQVALLWVTFATDPHFIVHGTTVYGKNQRDGLMTGVVGTTLFDTVKSLLAYDEWATQVSDFKEYGLLEEANAVKWFKKTFGLNVKEGTWKPTLVNELPTPGALWTDQKFLGVMMRWEQGPTKVEPVPWLPEEDWLSMVLNPRDDPSMRLRSGGGRATESYLTRSRRWFDRVRGYLITGGFSNDRIRLLLNGICNTIDPVAIVMGVQSMGGTGEVPESPVMGEDFAWPDSAGYPNEFWCQNLYFSEDNQWEGDHWQLVFPTVEERLKDFREKNKPMKPVMMVVEVAKKNPETGAVPKRVQQVMTYVDDGPLDLDVEQIPMEPISGPSKGIQRKLPEEFSKRSEIISYSPGLQKPVSEKKIPTFAEVLWGMFTTKSHPPVFPRTVEGKLRKTQEWIECDNLVREGEAGFDLYKTPVLSVNDLAATLGRSHEAVERTALSLGLYVVGKKYRLITKVPLLVRSRGAAEQQFKQRAKAEERVKIIGPTTSKISQALRHVTPAAPLLTKVVRHGPDPALYNSEFVDKGNPMSTLNHLMQKCGLIPKVKSRQVFENGVQMAETALSYVPVGETKEMRWLSVRGPNSKGNQKLLFEHVVSRYGLEMERAKEATLSWVEIVEKEERARFYAEGVVEMISKGGYLLPIKSVPSGPWTVEKGFVYIGGVLWKQRSNETLVGFCRRTQKALEERGYFVEYESLKTTLQPEYELTATYDE